MSHPNQPAPPSIRDAAGFTMLELLVVLGIVAVVAATAIPMLSNVSGELRLSGDARGLANSVALAKIQAAANFTQARVYVDLSTNSYRTDLWDKTNSAWVAQTGTRYLSGAGETYGFAGVGAAPSNTQTTIGEAPQCTDNSGVAIANTSCIVFNSRGIPIDGTGAPTGGDAFYVTDGSYVYAVTLSASSLIRYWQTAATGTPNWVQK